VQPAASVELQNLPEGKSSVSKTKLASVTPYKERAIMGDMKSVGSDDSAFI
jgi:hypothetical protein